MKRLAFMVCALLFSIVMIAQSADECYKRGVNYRFGRNGVRQDNVEAVKWYRKAAEKGHAEAQSNLGFMYHNGYGVKKDDAEAIKWYRKSAEQGCPLGQNNLGWMYQNGWGVPKDYDLALSWYQKAIAQGNANAMEGMGELYEFGYGVPQDYEKAKEWYQKALAKRPKMQDAKEGLARVEKIINGEVTIDGIKYIVNSAKKTAMVARNEGYNNMSGNVNIPSTIVFNGITCSVTSIGEEAFRFCKNVTSFTFPNSLTNINDYAFNHCEALSSITLPNSVTSIGNGAFNGCKALTSIAIPNSVTSIGERAFESCTALTSATLPNGINTIKKGTFVSCCSLKSITIPNSVTSIENYAFSGCKELTSINIPNSVTIICVNAFMNCVSLKSLTIPGSVKTIQEQAFYGCENLTSIVLSEGVTSIEKGAFRACKSLTSVKIANSVRNIDDYAFYQCASLKSLVIPEGVKSLGINIADFSVSIPQSVTNVGGSQYTGDVTAGKYIDLGLPSGTLWASCNVGAKKPEDLGIYYQWGREYGWNKDSSISLTIKKLYEEYNSDILEWNRCEEGDLPDLTQVKELINNCTWTYLSYKGTYGALVTGSNGNTIFLPFDEENYPTNHLVGHYWTSTRHIKYDEAYVLIVNPGNWYSKRERGLSFPESNICGRYNRLNVRCVSKKVHPSTTKQRNQRRR